LELHLRADDADSLCEVGPRESVNIGLFAIVLGWVAGLRRQFARAIVLEMLRLELRTTMRQAVTTSVAKITRTYVVVRPF
jgi:hypothetical protein